MTALLLLVSVLPAEQAPVSSARTDLSGSACATIKSSVEEDWATFSCPAPEGYGLQVDGDDGRYTVTLIDPDGTEHPQDYWWVVTRGFSSLGAQAEWRLEDGRPTALIVPVLAEENTSDGSTREVPYLVVSKVTADETCVIDRVGPGPDQRARARAAADGGAEADCLLEVPMEAVGPAARYCYLLEEEVLTARVRVDADYAGELRGRVEASIHDEREGYFSSYVQRLSGRLDTPSAEMSGTARVDVRTWIEFDAQQETQRWTLTPERLETPDGAYSAVSCDGAAALPDGLEQLGVDPVSVWTYPLELTLGTPETVSSGVVRGERDQYRVLIEEGDVLALSISAVEDNAVFDLIDPSDTVLLFESVEAEVELPYAGEYRIIVGGTRGNASYDLVVELR